MIKLIKNAYVYSPEEIGIVDILISGDKIVWIEKNMNIVLPDVEVYDAKGLIAIPGLIDPHVHITGGGGEGGFVTRTPELKISDCVKSGITTIIGCLGTDGITRSLENLYAKAKALEKDGLTTYIYTGFYRVPPITFTGSIQRDLVLIDKVIGTGEIAISDHRSSQPTFEEILRVVADTRLGGIISGKSGVVNFHVGEGERGIEWLFDIVKKTEIPIKHLYPTHMSRNKKLFERGLEFARIGGFIDLTGIQPVEETNNEFNTIDAILLAHDNGLLERITISSDGQGSLPKFDKNGSFVGLDVGNVNALIYTIKLAVKHGAKFEDAIKLSTTNPAKVFELKEKGRIAVNYDADIVFLKEQEVLSVLSRGKFLMKDGKIEKFNFE